MLYRIKVVRNNCQMQVCPGCSVDTWGTVSATSGTAAALVRGPFADAALGTLGTAHRAAGAAACGEMGKAGVSDAFPRHLSAKQQPCSKTLRPREP